MPVLLYFLLAAHVIMCALMILVTLMQRPRSEGLGAAFGGGMTDNMFGAQTTNVLAKFTTWLGGLFFVVTLILAMLYARMGTSGETKIQQELKNLPAPAAAASPATTDAVIPATDAVPAEPTSVEPTPEAVTPAGEGSAAAVEPANSPATMTEATTNEANQAREEEPAGSLVKPSPAPLASPE